jgi:hypothetical protein
MTQEVRSVNPSFEASGENAPSRQCLRFFMSLKPASLKAFVGRLKRPANPIGEEMNRIARED